MSIYIPYLKKVVFIQLLRLCGVYLLYINCWIYRKCNLTVVKTCLPYGWPSRAQVERGLVGMHFPPNIINKLTTPTKVIRLGHLDHLVHTTHTKFYSGNPEVDDMVMLNLELKLRNVCVDRSSVGSSSRLFWMRQWAGYFGKGEKRLGCLNNDKYIKNNSALCDWIEGEKEMIMVILFFWSN